MHHYHLLLIGSLSDHCWVACLKLGIQSSACCQTLLMDGREFNGLVSVIDTVLSTYISWILVNRSLFEMKAEYCLCGVMIRHP